VINDTRAEAAAEFIRDNAKRHGQLKGAALFAEYKIKRARSVAFLEAEGTVAEREAKAWMAEEVRLASEEHRDATADEIMLRDQIEAANLTFEVWRTQAADRRKGM
jgi:hypothetical protein